MLIALSTVFLSRQPRERHLLPAGAAASTEGLLEAVAPRRLRLIRTLARPVLRSGVHGLERAALPGIQRHYAARKRYIDDAARAFLSDPGGQLVVVGAGLDTLALRIARELPDVRCVELDHPATSAVKQRALGGDVPSNLDLLPLQLGEGSLAQVRGLDRTLPTFVVVEGLTMYLSEQAVQETLLACAQLPPGSQVLWTFMEPDPGGRLRFHHAGRAVDGWLDHQGEPFTWGLPSDEVTGFVRPLGLEVRAVATAADLRRHYLQPLGISGALAEGEVLCLCQTTG
ncbi:class I SAM-dependent methyltransferase [Serinicoccus kebangsaanensis]|uniref:class I SAM-dependent methyltransferase n=1 Tax=Serinicoccus kebangsaanensis TaxID=2602069 RepID=UPI00124E8269|nr:SAM-dependent methyltransferase [Serinicoccus kebangsaanensis]